MGLLDRIFNVKPTPTFMMHMTPKVRKLYLRSLEDTEFLHANHVVDGTKPTDLVREIDKVIFASVYYGYLLGKYGVDHEFIKEYKS